MAGPPASGGGGRIAMQCGQCSTIAVTEETAQVPLRWSMLALVVPRVVVRVLRVSPLCRDGVEYAERDEGDDDVVASPVYSPTSH